MFKTVAKKPMDPTNTLVAVFSSNSNWLFLWWHYSSVLFPPDNKRPLTLIKWNPSLCVWVCICVWVLVFARAHVHVCVCVCECVCVCACLFQWQKWAGAVDFLPSGEIIIKSIIWTSPDWNTCQNGRHRSLNWCARWYCIPVDHFPAFRWFIPFNMI